MRPAEQEVGAAFSRLVTASVPIDRRSSHEDDFALRTPNSPSLIDVRLRQTVSVLYAKPKKFAFLGNRVGLALSLPNQFTTDVLIYEKL